MKKQEALLKFTEGPFLLLLYMNPLNLGTLEPLDPRSIWADEARDFTPWLATALNLEKLSDILQMDLELQGVEVPVGPYKADIVAFDQTSECKVVIENQLEKTDHDHLGKIITYASGLEAQVIVWIARSFTEEHRQAVDYMNEKASPSLRIYAIEIAAYKIGASLPAPFFKLVASPNEYAAVVKETAEPFTTSQALYLEFWTAFREWCQTTGTTLKLRKPRAQHWFSIAVGRSRFQISITASTMHNRIGCEIYMRGANAKQAFKLLKLEKISVENQTGPLEWQELPDKQDCRIAVFKPDFDPANKAIWDQGFEWLKKEAELFHKVFSPLIRALPIADEEEESEDKENDQH